MSVLSSFIPFLLNSALNPSPSTPKAKFLIPEGLTANQYRILKSTHCGFI